MNIKSVVTVSIKLGIAAIGIAILLISYLVIEEDEPSVPIVDFPQTTADKSGIAPAIKTEPDEQLLLAPSNAANQAQTFRIDERDLYERLNAVVTDKSLRQYPSLINLLTCDEQSKFCELWVQINIEKSETPERAIATVTRRIDSSLNRYRTETISAELFVRNLREEPEFMFVEYVIAY